MFSITKPQQYVSAASLTSNVDNVIQDSVATMKVCRVCLAMTAKMYHLSDHKLNVMYERVTGIEVRLYLIRLCKVCLAMSVKMYHMSEHKLSVMFEQVTGVEINTWDKLPKMLCWECVARLSSANNFKEKALKTQWMLMNKINSGSIVTISDIESIDRAQHQLESTLGFKVHTEDDSNFYTIKESDITDDHFYIETHKLFVKSEPEFCELNDDINNDEEQTFIPEVNVTDPIKREYLDESEENNVSYEDSKELNKEIKFQNRNSLFITVEIEKEENVNGKAMEMAFDNVSNVNEASDEENHILDVSRNMKRDTVTGQVNRRIKALPHCKELRVDVKDAMLTSSMHNIQDPFNQLTDQSLEDSVTALRPEIKMEVLEEKNNFVENLTIDVASTVDNFFQNDTEYSKKLLICDICGKQFQNRSTLTLHIQNHPKMHSCTYCGYQACQRTDLKKHVNRMHTKDISFNCSFCSYTAYAKSTLARHVEAKHSNTDGYNCSFCSYKTYQKCTLTRHVNSKHTKEDVYNCSLCDYIAHDKGNLTRHVNAKHTKANVYNCSYCNYKAYNKSNLTIHVEVKHAKTNVYNCPYCSHTAYYKGALTRHVNSKHTKTNVYNCSHCSYETFDKSGLIRHVNAIHTKKVTYDCSLCSYKAYQKSSLTGHINAKHTKTKVYSCALCSYTAYHKSNLSGHINAKHTKAKVYNCSLCSYETYHRSNLAAHVNTKHTTSISNK